MLPQKQRIQRKYFLRRNIKNKVSYSKNITLRIYKKHDCEKEGSKFSFVVSNKISKNTPIRNKLKRRGYSTIKNLKGKINPCFTCIFYFKKESLLLNYSELNKEIKELLKENNII